MSRPERLNFRDHWPSLAAVGATILGVLAIETIAPKDEMISDGVDRIRATKIGSVAVPVVVIATALHLLRVQQRLGVEFLDPYYHVSKLKHSPTTK